jgi:hypothetical protein
VGPMLNLRPVLEVSLPDGYACRCGGRGYYVVTPEDAGWHRALSRDRHAGVAPKKRYGSDASMTAVRTRLSTAYVNDRGSEYHFSADDPGGFGRMCEVHGPKFQPDVLRENGESV